MKIESLELALVALEDVMRRVPDKDEVIGLDGDVASNFRKLCDATADIEDSLEKMKTAVEVRNLFKPKKS